jgi:ankyrin repeat protein
MHAAIEDGDVELSQALLEQLPTALINTIGPEGDTLLHIACLYSHEACVKLLLEHSASIDVRDDDNSSVLHDSAAGGCDSSDAGATQTSTVPA